MYYARTIQSNNTAQRKKKPPIGLQTKELYNLLKSKNLDARYMETLEKM